MKNLLKIAQCRIERSMSEKKQTILITIASCLSSRDSFRKLLHVSIMEDGHLFKTLRALWKRTHLRLSMHIICVSRNFDNRVGHLRRRLCIYSTNNSTRYGKSGIRISNWGGDHVCLTLERDVSHAKKNLRNTHIFEILDNGNIHG